MVSSQQKHKQAHQSKVDGFIREALAEKNLFLRARLLGKAVYWNLMAMKADPDVKFIRGKPIAPDHGQTTS
ncbi:MAG: hypothetical protein WC563_05955 [Brevundimonas sp.]|jgi:hypothetical protein